jgi:hypothetical protein
MHFLVMHANLLIVSGSEKLGGRCNLLIAQTWLQVTSIVLNKSCRASTAQTEKTQKERHTKYSTKLTKTCSFLYFWIESSGLNGARERSGVLQ